MDPTVIDCSHVRVMQTQAGTIDQQKNIFVETKRTEHYVI